MVRPSLLNRPVREGDSPRSGQVGLPPQPSRLQVGHGPYTTTVGRLRRRLFPTSAEVASSSLLYRVLLLPLAAVWTACSAFQLSPPVGGVAGAGASFLASLASGAALSEASWGQKEGVKFVCA